MSLIGERLREARIRRGLTQAEVAEKLGVTRSVIARYESGINDPPSENISKLAEILGVSADYLLGRTDNPTSSNGSGGPPIEEEFPEVVNVLRRSGKKLTPEDRKRIARIIKAAIEDVEE